MNTFDLFYDGRQAYINNAPGSDFKRYVESAHVARSVAINRGTDVDMINSTTGEVVASYDPTGKRTWPPADTSMISRADWVH